MENNCEEKLTNTGDEPFHPPPKGAWPLSSSRLHHTQLGSAGQGRFPMQATPRIAAKAGSSCPRLLQSGEFAPCKQSVSRRLRAEVSFPLHCHIKSFPIADSEQIVVSQHKTQKVKEALQDLLSLIARPRCSFACRVDRHVFPLSPSKWESGEKHYSCKK